MLETIGKTIMWTFILIGAPVLLLVAIFTIGAAAPIIGLIMLFALPAIIVGIAIGRKSMEKKDD